MEGFLYILGIRLKRFLFIGVDNPDIHRLRLVSIVSNADVNLTKSSQATINVDGTLNVDLSNSSKVVYVGEPTMVDIEVDWESDITKNRMTS